MYREWNGDPAGASADIQHSGSGLQPRSSTQVFHVSLGEKRSMSAIVDWRVV